VPGKCRAVPDRHLQEGEEKTMTIWLILAVTAASLATSILVLVTRPVHHLWTSDFEDSGVQKHHKGNPPRVGALPLIAGLAIGAFLLAKTGWTTQAGSTTHMLVWLMVASLPVVALGLADDVTKRIPPRVRMLGAAAAGLLAVALLDVRIPRADVVLLDSALGWAPVSVALTLLMVCGFTNAMNIVDGLNGLAGGLALMMLTATGFVAARLGDTMVLELCMVLGSAVLGFLLVNFPKGLMFLGDGGAYLIGFLIVQIWILLVMRNPTVTPWFVVAVAFHPTMETVFSIYRRRFHPSRRGAAMLADRLHLHSLVYRRRAAVLYSAEWAEPWVANAAGSTMVLAFAGVPMALAVIWPEGIVFNIVLVLTGVAAYLFWFMRLVRFRGARDSATSAAEYSGAR